MPVRIQRKRTKGWRMPAAAVYVGRRTRWGNPITVDEAGGRQQAADAYRAQIREPRNKGFREAVRRDLRGKDLACWCPTDAPCHADVLLELANDERT